MNKEKAVALVDSITKLLTGRNLVTVQKFSNNRIEVRTFQKFDKAYLVEHNPGNCVVAVRDSYGVMTGAEKYEINPERRTIYAATTNGFDEPIAFTWTVDEKDDDGEIYTEFRKEQQKIINL